MVNSFPTLFAHLRPFPGILMEAFVKANKMEEIPAMTDDDLEGTIFASQLGDYRRQARPEETSRMNIVTVYRIDYAKRTRVPIGVVVERRKRDRGNNLVGLLRVARKTYSSPGDDSIHIAIDAIGGK